MSTHRRPLELLPRVVTGARAAELGLTTDQCSRRVRAGVWTRLADGVYCTQPPHTDGDLLLAAACHAGSGGMLTGAGALVVHGVARVGPVARPTVLVPYRNGVRSTPLIQVRRASRLPVAAVVSGVRVAPLPRAVVDHAMTLQWRGDVRALLARAVQRHGVRPDALDDALSQVATRGSRLVRVSLAEISAGARSAPEAEAAAVLTAAGLGGFEQNAPLAPWGLVLVADFLWRALRAVLEIDSVEYHFDDADYQATLERAAVIKSRGLDTLHVSPRMVRRSPEAFVHRTRDWLLARAALLGVDPPWLS